MTGYKYHLRANASPCPASDRRTRRRLPVFGPGTHWRETWSERPVAIPFEPSFDSLSSLTLNPTLPTGIRTPRKLRLQREAWIPGRFLLIHKSRRKPTLAPRSAIRTDNMNPGYLIWESHRANDEEFF
jgi:hypothetical protein